MWRFVVAFSHMRYSKVHLALHLSQNRDTYLLWCTSDPCIFMRRQRVRNERTSSQRVSSIFLSFFILIQMVSVWSGAVYFEYQTFFLFFCFFTFWVYFVSFVVLRIFFLSHLGVDFTDKYRKKYIKYSAVLLRNSILSEIPFV